MAADNLIFLALAVVVAAALPSRAWSVSSPPTRTLAGQSRVYTLDREHRSMKGPHSKQTIDFPQAESPELVWVTGYRTRIVGADGETPMSAEYMCHSNLDFDASRHSALLRTPVYHSDRLFTLSQGQLDIELPQGFGLPFYTDESFTLTTQVLNLNHDGRTRQVRHKVAIDYVRDRDLKEPMQPLFMTSAWGLVLLDGENGYYGVSDPSREEHGPGCLPGEAAGRDEYTDGERKFSGHWVVKPGREVNRTLVTNIMNVPYDTTAHYIAVHLHPFAESLELVDRTAGKSVFKSRVRGSKEKIGIEHVEHYSSEEGIPVYKNHEYELVSIYDNTTSEDQDSMAVMLLYMRDREFHPIDRASVEVAKVERPVPLSDDVVVLHTSLGDIELALYPTAAPNHTRRILELARLGVYDGTSFNRIEAGFLAQTSLPQQRSGAPLTAEQLAAIRLLRAELNDLEHRRGAVSMVLRNNADPHSAEAAFFILLGDAPHLDGRYTIVGRVVSGMEVLDRMADRPRQGNPPPEPIEIDSAKVVRRQPPENERAQRDP